PVAALGVGGGGAAEERGGVLAHTGAIPARGCEHGDRGGRLAALGGSRGKAERADAGAGGEWTPHRPVVLIGWTLGLQREPDVATGHHREHVPGSQQRGAT